MAEIVSNLKGPQGDLGPKGDAGDIGPQGPAGSDATIPPGTVSLTVAAVAPAGWLMFDGSTVVGGQTLHPALWGVIPESMKSGADILLPDSRGRALFGAGAGAGLTDRPLLSVGGEESVILLDTQMPNHKHTIQLNYQQVQAGVGYSGYTQQAGGGAIQMSSLTTGGGGAHNNMPPFLALNVIVKT